MKYDGLDIHQLYLSPLINYSQYYSQINYSILLNFSFKLKVIAFHMTIFSLFLSSYKREEQSITECYRIFKHFITIK